MSNDLFPLGGPSQSPLPQRRGARLSANGKPLGRPPGAQSKRSVDLARYIEATFAGQTPGQQAAQLAMVTAKDLKNAKADAHELNAIDWAQGVIDVSLPPLLLAMAVKAARLAQALGCDRRDAWLLLQKEREALMPYVHQKRAPLAEEKGGRAPATVFLVPEGEANQAQLPDFSGEDDDVDFTDFSDAAAGEVTPSKSQDDT